MITPGIWEVSNSARGLFNVFEKSRGSLCMISCQSAQEEPDDRDNAALMAEAGTVANETGLTPRQLLKQRDELLKELERSRSVIWKLAKLAKYYGYEDELPPQFNTEREKAIANAKKKQ